MKNLALAIAMEATYQRWYASKGTRYTVELDWTFWRNVIDVYTFGSPQ